MNLGHRIAFVNPMGSQLHPVLGGGAMKRNKRLPFDFPLSYREMRRFLEVNKVEHCGVHSLGLSLSGVTSCCFLGATVGLLECPRVAPRPSQKKGVHIL